MSSINNHKIHVQIDEKFIHNINKRCKKRHYTCSIFKGVKSIGKRRILLNRYLISSNSLSTVFKRLNYILTNKYHVSWDDQIYLSGDLATYIQNAPDRIIVCKTLYVPDKYNIKAALKKTLGLIVTDKELCDASLQKQLLDALRDSPDIDFRKLYTLLSSNPNCFNAYLDLHYDGCSQEAMNSHYYCSRFDKVPNSFSSRAIEHLSSIINARENNQLLVIGFKSHYYDSPILFDIDLSSPHHREYINKSNMKSQTRKLFADIESGIY